MRSTSTTASHEGLLARLRMICTPQILRKALLAAVVVGILLVVLNHGDVFMAGQVTRSVLVKSLVTPLIPFCVTLLGALLNSHPAARPEEIRPGGDAVRRSVGIALLVGSTIIVVNQGDVLLAGALTPRLLVKLLLTPCIPFCVSLYGAYVAYWSALATHHAATAQSGHAPPD